MATTLEHLVADLADREAIRELPQRYCDCVWRGDVAGIVNLYAEDGTFAIAGGGRDRTVTGRANLLKAYGEDLSTIKPRPYIHNHVIELKGAGRASGRCYVEVPRRREEYGAAGHWLLQRRIREGWRRVEVSVTLREPRIV